MVEEVLVERPDCLVLLRRSPDGAETYLLRAPMRSFMSMKPKVPKRIMYACAWKLPHFMIPVS